MRKENHSLLLQIKQPCHSMLLAVSPLWPHDMVQSRGRQNIGKQHPTKEEGGLVYPCEKLHVGCFVPAFALAGKQKGLGFGGLPITV